MWVQSQCSGSSESEDIKDDTRPSKVEGEALHQISEVADEMRILSHYLETLFGSHFICFTGTKVRILTHKAMLVPVDAELDTYTGGHDMYARVHTHTRSTHVA